MARADGLTVPHQRDAAGVHHRDVLRLPDLPWFPLGGLDDPPRLPRVTGSLVFATSAV
jgi:hypothetical protein